jgi:tripartite-type tricarboxylate transporter receptor subunit TctC
LLIANPGAAQTVEEFYTGKTITIVLGHPPGGSYDFYARLAAQHLKAHLPGHPNIIVNHRPGGGGVAAAAFFYAQSPRDGTALSLFSETIAHTQVLEPAIGRWKMQEMSYIGSLSSVNTAFIVRKGAPAQTIFEMKRVQNVIGCTGVNSQGYQYPAMLKALGGFNFKMICGYPGSAEILLAMQKGEADMTSSSWNNLRISQIGEIKAGNLVPVIQGGIRRNRELLDVPLVQDLVDGDEAKSIVMFASAGSGIGRALLAPPRVPADRIAALRNAFDQMMKDPALLADAAKRGLEIDPTAGVDVQKISDGVVMASPALIEKAAKALK